MPQGSRLFLWDYKQVTDLSSLATCANIETAIHSVVHIVPKIKANISSVNTKGQEVFLMNPQAAGKFYINSILINFMNIIDIILTSPHLLSLCKACFILNVCICICMHAQLCPTLCDSVNCSLPGSPCPWDSPGKNLGMGCHFLLQGNHPHPRIKPMSPLSPALAGRFFTPVPPGKPNTYIYICIRS